MVEIALGVSEANNEQLYLTREIMADCEHMAIHADHADGSVHPRFVRDAFLPFETIGNGCAGPCDIHLYLRRLDDAVSTISRFSNEIAGCRCVHVALESIDSIHSVQALLDHSHSRGLEFVPSIQTDPFDEKCWEVLLQLIRAQEIRRISILMPGNRIAANGAGRIVADIYKMILEQPDAKTPDLCLDRNCDPTRVQQVVKYVPVSAVVCGSFLWSANNVQDAIIQLRASATQGPMPDGY